MRAPFSLLAALVCSPIWAGWEAIGPFGGPAAIVQVDRHHPGRVLAATGNAQIFRSDDEGGSWRAIPFPAQLRSTLHAFVVDAHNPGIYFAGVASDDPEYSGIYRTSDSGATWKHLAGIKSVWAIAMWRDSRLMGAGTVDGVYLSRDAGENWERAGSPDKPGPKPVVSLAFDQVDPKIIYAGTPHLPWKTTDNGASWDFIPQGMFDDSDVFSILIDGRRRQTLFASVCGGMYRSLDSGEQWKPLTKAKGASARTYHITQNPVKMNVLLAGTTFGLVRSDDNGASWRKLSDLPTRYIAFDSGKPDRIFVATDAGLFRSDDLGQTLQAVNRGFANRRIGAIALLEKTLYVSAPEPGGTSIIRLDGSEWKPAPMDQDPALEKMQKTVTTDSHGLLLATVHGLMRSDDAGKTWRPVEGVLGASTVSAICKHPSRKGVLFAAQYSTVFISTDDGRSWKKFAPIGDASEGFQALLVMPGSPDRLLGVTQNRGVYAMDLIGN
ncbi:MAG: hypothetical protein JO307_16460 [Bryobacterales bacterium]|nr:hypothetical protein [Bryobacterales bacterium]MBV9400068.1 hypothetical protein [Bryobacterales bacterium]